MATLTSTPPTPMPTAQPGAPTVAEASPAQVREWLASGACILIDVREPDEHARERITGAQALPLSRFDAAHAGALARPGQRIVMHCKSGRRSADAVRQSAVLAATGVRVLSMSGGIEAWRAAGLPTEVNTRVARWSIMRQVQLTIGVCVLAGSALAWFVHPGLVAIPAFFGAGLVFAGTTGTCGLAALVALLPWNRVGRSGTPGGAGGTACERGRCS